MRAFISKILSMLSAAMRTVWVRCAKTGRWIAKTVRAPLGIGAGAPAQDESPELPPTAEKPHDDLANVRRLAGAMAGDRVSEADLRDVPDARIEWLAAMDRGMLAKVLCADDQALRAHIKGERAIRGVLAADRASVAAYVQAMSVTLTDDEEEPQPVYGMAA